MSPPIVRDPDNEAVREEGGPSRRGFLGGLATALAAAALIRPAARALDPAAPGESPRLPRWIGHY